MQDTGRRSALVGIAIVALSIGLFVGIAKIGGAAFVDAQRSRELNSYAELVLRRAELEVDFAIVALSELAQNGVTDCSPQSLAAMRRHVYERSTIKDIRIVDGSLGATQCSAFSETLEFDTQPLEIEAFQSRNTAIRLARLEQHSGHAMSVFWEIDDGVTLAAVVNTAALLFAILPHELRDYGEVRLELADGSPVAEYLTQRDDAVDPRMMEFTAVSDRYPFTARIGVARSVYKAWNRGPERYFLAAGGILGLAFGGLAAGVFVRRPDQTSELDRALAAREFRPFLQPIVALDSGEIVGCEVLARWMKADGSVESPLRFIRKAEDSGRIVPLTAFLVSEALDHLRPWMSKRRDFKAAFNIYPGHLMADGFVEEFKALVDNAGVPRGQVVIELTERHELTDLAAAAERIMELRVNGFKVAIDDAGTGHSGLSYLQRLGVDIVKIDKLFVDSIESDHSARVIVDMLVRVAGKLGMRTVAEGVERPEQVAALKVCGVDEIQGYLISRALPPTEFLRLLHAAAEPEAHEPVPEALTA